VEVAIKLTKEDVEQAIKKYLRDAIGLSMTQTPVQWKNDHSVELLVEDED